MQVDADAFGSYNDLGRLEEISEKLNSLNDRLEMVKETLSTINSREVLFDFPPTGARTHSVCKYQSCMLENVGRTVRRPG